MPPAGAIDPNWRIYARSASDDKLGVMAIIAAVDALRAQGKRPAYNLKIFFEGEEEAGSPNLAALLAKHRDTLRSDGWVIFDGPTHPTGAPQVSLGVRGDVNVDVTVHGPVRPLHSGHYGNWVPNPAMVLSQLLASMKDAERPGDNRGLLRRCRAADRSRAAGDPRRPRRRRAAQVRARPRLDRGQRHVAARRDPAAVAQHQRHPLGRCRRQGAQRHPDLRGGDARPPAGQGQRQQAAGGEADPPHPGSGLPRARPRADDGRAAALSEDRDRHGQPRLQCRTNLARRSAGARGRGRGEAVRRGRPALAPAARCRSTSSAKSSALRRSPSASPTTTTTSTPRTRTSASATCGARSTSPPPSCRCARASPSARGRS